MTPRRYRSRNHIGFAKKRHKCTSEPLSRCLEPPNLSTPKQEEESPSRKRNARQKQRPRLPSQNAREGFDVVIDDLWFGGAAARGPLHHHHPPRTRSGRPKGARRRRLRLGGERGAHGDGGANNNSAASGELVGEADSELGGDEDGVRREESESGAGGGGGGDGPAGREREEVHVGGWILPPRGKELRITKWLSIMLSNLFYLIINKKQ